MPHGSRGWMRYTATNFGAVDFSLKCDPFTAANNGQTMAPTPPIENFWPMHASTLRRVYGNDVTNKYQKDTCVAATTAGVLYNLGANFTDEFGNNYIVVGLKSERYSIRNVL